MNITTIKELPGIKPLAPYSLAKIVEPNNSIIYLSGQIPIDENNNIVSDQPGKQIQQCMINAQKILESANSDLNNVIKVVIYLTDMSYYQEINQVYGQFFNENLPVRTCIAVSALPKNSKVEVDIIAIQKAKMVKESNRGKKKVKKE